MRRRGRRWLLECEINPPDTRLSFQSLKWLQCLLWLQKEKKSRFPSSGLLLLSSVVTTKGRLVNIIRKWRKWLMFWEEQRDRTRSVKKREEEKRRRLSFRSRIMIIMMMMITNRLALKIIEKHEMRREREEIIIINSIERVLPLKFTLREKQHGLMLKQVRVSSSVLTLDSHDYHYLTVSKDRDHLRTSWADTKEGQQRKNRLSKELLEWTKSRSESTMHDMHSPPETFQEPSL